MFRGEVSQEDITRLVKKLRALPDRADKDMRKEFRLIAKEALPKMRSRAVASHPARRTRKHKGSYKWGTLVNAIVSGADGDSPYLKYGAPRVPGWAGHEFGSNRLPQFGPRNKEGLYFWPYIKEARKEAEPRVKEVFEKYAAREFD